MSWLSTRWDATLLARSCLLLVGLVEQEEVGIGGDCPGEGGMQDAVRGTAGRVYLLVSSAVQQLCAR